MAKKKGRDWSEWKEHITGMHRLDNGFKQQHMGTRFHQLQTQTSLSYRNRDLDDDEGKQPRIWVWVLVFVGMLLIRFCYFEHTKQERIKERETMSREK